MTDFHDLLHTDGLNAQSRPLPDLFGHPDDVLANSRLTIDEKRAVLASWASDANAVPHVPSLRQLPDGSIVKVEEILQALKKLDQPDDRRPAVRLPLPFGRHHGSILHSWMRRGRGQDDDDDPPPCPAIAARQPRNGGGAAFNVPELVAA